MFQKMFLWALVVAGILSQSTLSHAYLNGCMSAAANVKANGGSCDFQEETDSYVCIGKSGTGFNLVPGDGPTGCDIQLWPVQPAS